MKELSKHGWYELSNGQYYFHSCDFDVKRIIGRLVDCADMLKNKVGHSTLRETSPECVPLEENEKIMTQKKIRLTRRKILGQWLEKTSDIETRYKMVGARVK